MAVKRRRRAGVGTRVPNQGQMLETMHQVWLAGLGALADARKRGPKLLQELLAEGARIHQQTRSAADEALRAALAEVQTSVGERIEGARAQAGDALENLERLFQTRVHRALGQLGVPTADEIASLARRVDALNASVTALAARRGATRSARRGRRAAPRRRTARAA